MAENNKASTEWGAMKWIVTISGICGTALGAVLAALVASNTMAPNDTVSIVLGAISAVLLAISGQTGVAYIKGRSQVKAEREKLVPPPAP